MRTTTLLPLLLTALPLPLTLASSLNLGFTPLNTLLSRSTGCSSNDIVCGSTCIPSTYTCCPDLGGGCPSSSSTCQMGDNGEYGCCPTGEICEGDGGAQFIDTKTGEGGDSSSATGSASTAAASATGAQQSGNGAGVVSVNGGLMVAVVAGAAALL